MIKSNNSLFSPTIDFLTVGGLSYLFIIYMWFFPIPVNINLAAATYIAFVVNDPHFLSSYQLFYKNFTKKIKSDYGPAFMQIRYILAGILVPVSILAYFGYCLVTQDVQMLALIGNFMLLLVGWHYTKQSYGMLITLSALKKVFYSEKEKKIFLINSYVVWFATWLYMNNEISSYNISGIEVSFLQVPSLLLQTSLVACIYLGITCLALLVIRFVKKKEVSINGIIGYSTAYIWLFFRWNDPVTYILVPAFHSLQYLPFVLRYKINESNSKADEEGWDKTKTLRNILQFCAIALLLGYVFFHGLPNLFQSFIPYDAALFGPALFFFLFIIFINIHHYFIDNALWRKENKDVSTHLFSHTKA